MFLGEYEHRVDPQGRVAIPPRFREAFKGGLVLTRGYEQCIVVFTPGAWEQFSGAIATMSINQARGRRLRRMTFGGAFDLEMDRQGRVLIPQLLRRYATIGEEAVLVGTGEYIEIWDKELWRQELALTQESAWHLAEGAEERQERR